MFDWEISLKIFRRKYSNRNVINISKSVAIMQLKILLSITDVTLNLNEAYLDTK
jgi:hypothetical protein